MKTEVLESVKVKQEFEPADGDDDEEFGKLSSPKSESSFISQNVHR
jgi:hypothetical protein